MTSGYRASSVELPDSTKGQAMKAPRTKAFGPARIVALALISLPVKRIRARSAQPGVPIFRLQGGPGLSNMDFKDASRFADRHDVVLVGYRGVDGSSKLDCPEVTSALEHGRDFLSEESFRARGAAFKACANRLQHGGVDLA